MVKIKKLNINFSGEDVYINKERIDSRVTEKGILIEFKGEEIKFKNSEELCEILREKFNCDTEFDAPYKFELPDWCNSYADYENWCESEE